MVKKTENIIQKTKYKVEIEEDNDIESIEVKKVKNKKTKKTKK